MNGDVIADHVVILEMAPRPRRRRRAFALLGVIGLISISAATGAQSMAYFTSQATVSANAFTAGTVVLGTNPTTALITYSGIAPGDTVTAPLTVSNSGTLDLRYAVSSSATDADSKHLAAALTLVVKSGVTTCSNGGFGASGTTVYSGTLGSLVIGSATTGADTGDRNLAAGASEILCFQASLASSTGNSYQGSTTTATFTFDGEQTRNN